MNAGGKKKKILITGASGLLGNNLVQYFKDDFDVLGTYHEHPVSLDEIALRQVDLSDRAQVGQMIDTYKADIIIHCAALTDIEYCETHQEEAMKANVTATRNIVEQIKGRFVKLIYISTDSVFDGKKGDYTEGDAVKPLNFYGETKYQGEQESLKSENALVARTNIFGWNVQEKLCLAEWIIHELSCKKPIKGFKDVFFSSIYTFRLAVLLQRAITRGLRGIYHFASSNSMNKYDFAVRLADLFGLDPGLIEPISIDEFNFKAQRGKDLSLNIEKLKNDIGEDIPTIGDSLEHFAKDITKAHASVLNKGKI